MPITTLTGVITYTSSYVFMFGHCPIYLHSKRSAQGPAQILLYGMDIATAVFLNTQSTDTGGLSAASSQDSSAGTAVSNANIITFPMNAIIVASAWGAEQVVSLGVEKEKQGVPRSKDENDNEDDECNQCFELIKSCFLL